MRFIDWSDIIQNGRKYLNNKHHTITMFRYTHLIYLIVTAYPDVVQISLLMFGSKPRRRWIIRHVYGRVGSIMSTQLGMHCRRLRWYRLALICLTLLAPRTGCCRRLRSIQWLPMPWLARSPTAAMLNTLGPSDAIWRQRSWSTLAQVMACCLISPSHCLN